MNLGYNVVVYTGYTIQNKYSKSGEMIVSLLKKASIEDILNEQRDIDGYGSGFRYVDHYKEYELYLTKQSLDNYMDRTEEIKTILKNHNCVVRTVHCPESCFKTAIDRESSTNYLSLCEAVYDEESFSMLCETLEFAVKIQMTDIPIIVILHAGSIKGCEKKEKAKIKAEIEDDEADIKDFIQKLNSEVKNLKEGKVRIAIENVTPFYPGLNSHVKPAQNAGWGEEYINAMAALRTFNRIWSELKGDDQIDDDQDEKQNLFGLCIDFCHLMADHKYYSDNDIRFFNTKIIDFRCYVTLFFKKLDENRIDYEILLFHFSNLGDNGEHGEHFQEGNTIDHERLNVIREEWQKRPGIPATLEMKGGEYQKVSSDYFDKTMLDLSRMHDGDDEFGKILNTDHEKKKENSLFTFFNNMFKLYALPTSNYVELMGCLFSIKKYVFDHTPKSFEPKDVLFGFSYNEDDMDMASIRVQAYVFYTRFCNLGKYLADVYRKAGEFRGYMVRNKYIDDDKGKIIYDYKLDFIDSMHYFMFCDTKYKLCAYSGVGYSFNVDFLPKKVRLYRFNDGIKKLDDRRDDRNFGTIIKTIRDHINGTTIDNGKGYLYSLGKNFYTCLCKYCDCTKYKRQLRIHHDYPINYIRVGKKGMTIPKYLYDYELQKSSENAYSEGINYNLDVSSFKTGRDGEGTDTLDGFIRSIVDDDTGIEKTKCGSIDDGEVVCTELLEVSNDSKSSKEDLPVDWLKMTEPMVLWLMHVYNHYDDYNDYISEGKHIISGHGVTPQQRDTINRILKAVSVYNEDTNSRKALYGREDEAEKFYWKDKYDEFEKLMEKKEVHK